MNKKWRVAKIRCAAKKRWLLPLALAAGCYGSAAQAVLITFDDVSAEPICEDPEGFDCTPRPLSDQYASLGVLFGGGASLVGPEGGGDNAVSDWWGPGMSITFTGVLPTSVSMDVSALYEESVYLEIYGVDGLLTTLVTDGWRGTEENSTPYQPDQLMSFAGAQIAHIEIGDFYFRRGLLEIDNLNFSSDPVAVPEPPMFGVMALGLSAMLWRRRLTKR